MENTANQIDRRKFVRFEVVDEAYAVIMSDKGPLHGEIENISMRGLAFRHDGHEGPVEDVCRVCIFYEDAEFCIEDIPYRKVAEIEPRAVQKGNTKAGRSHKRCCMEFVDLTSNQELLLEHFIRNHTYRFG